MGEASYATDAQMVTRHPAGFCTYPGDTRSILGAIKGPTTFGSYVLAAGAEYDADNDKTHVAFVYATDDDLRAAVGA